MKSIKLIIILCLCLFKATSQPINITDFLPKTSIKAPWERLTNQPSNLDHNTADSLAQLCLSNLRQGIQPQDNLMLATALANHYINHKEHISKAKELMDSTYFHYSAKSSLEPSYLLSYYHIAYASYYNRIRTPKEKLECYEKACSILGRVDQNHPAMLAYLNSLMQAYFETRDVQRGFETFDKLNALSEKQNNSYYTASAYLGAGNILKFYNPGLASKFFDFVEFYVNNHTLKEFSTDPFFYISVGSGNTAINKHSKALEQYLKGLNSLNSSKDKNEILKSAFYYYIGVSHKNMGQNEQAIAYLDTAASMYKTLVGENDISYIRSINLKGQTLNNAKRFKEALPLNLAVSEYYLKTLGKFNTYQTQQGLREVARSYRGLGLLEDALNYSQMATCFYFGIDNPLPQLEVPDIEHLVRPDKNYMEAEYTIFSKVLTLMDMFRAKQDSLLLPVIFDHFDALMRITDINASVAQTPATLRDISDRLKYNSNQLLDFVFEQTLPTKYQKTAYLLTAKSKAYMLLYKNFASSNTFNIDKNANSKTTLQEELLTVNPEANPEGYIATYKEYLSLEKKEWEFKRNRSTSSNKILVPQLANTRAMNVCEKLSDNEMVIDFFVTKKNILSFIISPHSFTAHSFVLPEGFNEEISELFKSIKTSDKSNTNKLLEEFSFLFSNVNLDGINQLTIVPDEHLHVIPFDMIQINQSKIIQRVAIGYRYTSHLFRRESDYSLPPSTDFIAFAPVFDNQSLAQVPNIMRDIDLDEDMNDVFKNRNQFTPLPATPKELNEIARLFKSSKYSSNVYLRRESSKENFKQLVSKKGIIHIATHGYSNMRNENLSGLAFYSNHPKDSIASGYLLLGEIYNLNINADLVVLSACKSGYGNIARGEGVMGISRGFIAAGAKNVIASLWKVHDEKTKGLMVAFYKHLLKGKTYAESLRLAKLDCIDKGYLPIDWAGFVLIGG